MRADHGRALPLVLPVHAFAAAHEPDDEDEQAARPIPDGPLVVSLESLPPTGAHVVLANELLDNLAVRLLERTTEGWAEVGVDEALSEVLLPLAGVSVLAVPEAAVGSRVAWQQAASRWLREAIELAPRVVVIDYMTTTDLMAARPSTDWLRTYRGHDRGSSPLLQLGDQDITCEVALDQLAAVRPPSVVRDQSTFLAAHGVDQLVDDGRRAWEQGAAQGGLDALRGRSRVLEAEALADLDGLGGFTVAEWVL
jgi:SAM-dependent MidA family methyltransferase